MVEYLTGVSGAEFFRLHLFGSFMALRRVTKLVFTKRMHHSSICDRRLREHKHIHPEECNTPSI